MLVFNRRAVRKHRDRAAKHFEAHNVLFQESTNQLMDRLSDVKRDFETVLDLGAHQGKTLGSLKSVEKAFVVSADLSERMVEESDFPSVVADEEALPFAAHSFDLIVSNLSLHWVNDLPGALLQIKNTLKPEGLFMAALFGGNTLHELRASLLDAEIKVMGGASPRLSPTLELGSASALLQRAGFTLPVADQETLTLTYSNALDLMRDVRGMGEANAHLLRLAHTSRRAIFEEAAQIYETRFRGAEGLLEATFDILYLHGWKSGV